MHCVVYVLREARRKLPPDVVQSRQYPGWLLFGRDTRKFYPRAVARLFETERTRVDVIEPFDPREHQEDRERRHPDLQRR